MRTTAVQVVRWVRNGSRLFNGVAAGLCPVGGAASLALSTWNAHALLHLNPKKRNAKLAALRSYTKDIDIFTLQETHGSEEEMKDAFFWFAKDFYMFFSPSLDRNVGGAVVGVLHSAFKNPDIHHEQVVRGRVQRII